LSQTHFVKMKILFINQSS